jgi:valyl-tRNA synthetase
VIPFVTEELWTALTHGESLVITDWPTATGAQADEGSAQRIEGVRKLVTEIRRFRSDQGLKPGQKVSARLSGVAEAGLAAHSGAVTTLARLTEPGESFAASASLEVSVSGSHVLVELDLSGAVDIEAERKRLAKDLAVAQKELAQCDAKLGNPKFTEKAPADVVDKIKVRRDAAVADIDRINARIGALPQT